MPASAPAASIPIRLALLAAAAGAAACLWMGWCLFPGIAWNELRLAPAFALRHGINPYPLLGGGPLSTWIYGPVGILVNLPTTFATSPAGALRLASLITAVTIVAPLAVIFFASRELRARGAWAPWLALTLGVLMLPVTGYFFQVPDQTAIALGLLSGWCLACQPDPSGARLAAAALLGVLAIWTKQLAVPLMPVHVAFLLLSGNRPAALRYVGWFAIFALLAIGIFVPAFGWDNLWLTLIAIPGRLPWADIADRIAVRPWELVAQVLLPSLGLVALWRTGRWPDRTQESGRFFQFTVLAYVALLPLGLAAFFKIGGDTNTLHSWHYLLPGCLIAWLAADRLAGIGSARLLAVASLALAVHANDLTSLPSHPLREHFDDAAQLNAAYPHAIWFPQNPIITFYADGRLWHSEDGVRTRNFAGYAPSQADFRRHLPPNLQVIAYPEKEDVSLATALLSEFSQRTVLRHWILLTRPSTPPAPR